MHRAILRSVQRIAAAIVVAAIGVTSGASNRSPALAHSSSSAHAGAGSAGTVWLCRPGMANDPCTASLATTVVRSDGSTTVKHAVPAANPSIDCFYVYPTVSAELGLNSDLKVQRAEVQAAIAQASRFSQVCRVWAPMYRQRTLVSLALPVAITLQADAIAYQSLLAGWQDYLAHYNDGRPMVFIGHSQGAAMLIRLLQTHVDGDPVLRRRMVSAIILGGNVTVPTAKGASGSFAHIPPCRSASQTSCVIAYSSFPKQPPANSYFGRPGLGVSVQAGQRAKTGVRVLCVNPAAMSGGTGPLDPYFPAADLAPARLHVSTPWVEYPGLFTATCKSGSGATWLNVVEIAARTDFRPRVPQTGGPRWGYHVADVNLALGNLIEIVGREIAAYGRTNA